MQIFSTEDQKSLLSVPRAVVSILQDMMLIVARSVELMSNFYGRSRSTSRNI